MEGLTRAVARQIIDSVGGAGQPPAYGFQYFSAGLGPYLKVIEDEYLQSFVFEGGSSFKMVVGPYGGGKTHLLYSIRELAWKNNFVTSYIELRPDQTPFHRLELVYSSIVREICPPQSPEEVLAGQSRGIESLLNAALIDERRRLRDRGAGQADVTDELRSWIEGFSRFDSISFQRAIRAACVASLEGRDEEFETICQWIRGEGYVRSVHSKFGILQKVDRTTAFSMIRSLIQLTRDLNYSGMVVLIDEAEPLSSLNSKQREILLSNLRELIDECGHTNFKHAMFIYAVPDENFLEQRGQVYQALTQRLSTVFERANPTGVKILLDNVWSDPITTLVEIGRKLAAIYEVAFDKSLEAHVTEANILKLAQDAYAQRFGDIGYRRLFVQAVVRALGQIAIGEPVTPITG